MARKHFYEVYSRHLMVSELFSDQHIISFLAHLINFSFIPGTPDTALHYLLFHFTLEINQRVYRHRIEDKFI